MGNQSIVTEFLLTGFVDDHDTQILHLLMFLSIYLTAVVGNLLIIAAVTLDHHLHNPMYFFLANLSFLDVCYISTTVPKSIAVSVTKNKLISFAGCVAQVFLVVTFVGGELFLLTVMAYDRYVAICHPLQYNMIMNSNACIQMAATAWISSLIHAVLETSLTFSVNFCGSNKIGQFFCDMALLQKMTCIDSNVHTILILILGVIIVTFCIGLLFASYGYIFSAVLKIPSVQARYKAFSMCTPHLTVFSLFVITATFSYMIPKTLSTPIVDLVSACLYTLLPPVLNPIIYSLRNKDIQKSVWKISSRLKYLLG
ncbi:olfactory receptor 14A16-like [Python bivittatus]|uniref:Olfactory receptor n=1 Tax=Python bivittatus TaxID=176946 RepID=A0A9F5J4F9_PYTBI|nr:olfactory receptor 14A16-like [Python bivittatus]